MSYNNEHNVRIQDLKMLAEIVKGVEERVSDLETLAKSLLEITNSVIRNIERTD